MTPAAMAVMMTAAAAVMATIAVKLEVDVVVVAGVSGTKAQ